MSSPHDVTFGTFRLDLHNECLWTADRAIALRPKAFAVLKLLVENSGQLVTKQQLLDTVWPGTFVTDAVLKDSIRQLRDALGDQADAPTYIETSHRRGYRFLAKISQAAAVAEDHRSSSVPAMVPVPVLPPARVVARTATTVVGREGDLAKLRACFELAGFGERQLVFVTGEAGIGKTSVVAAFLDEIGDVPGIRIARGQCLEHYGSGEPYMPVLEGFSRLARGELGGSVAAALRTRAPAWLAQMPAMQPGQQDSEQPFGPAATRARMLREMAETLEVLSAEHPFILLVEDLHWGDYSTLDLISYVARRRDPAKLMVIATYRPVEVIVSDHPLKAVKRDLQSQGICSELALEYLPEHSIRDYLGLRFPGSQFRGRLARIIHQRTEGNPLFMINAVEYLTRERLIVEEDGSWKLPHDLSAFATAVPDNVRALIEKQLERLTPDERMVLEAASVAGMDCSTEAIAAGLDKPKEWVDRHCEQLARRHHFLSPARLVELPDGTVTPRYTFNHVLYLEVPYALMAPMTRVQLHQRIAVRGMEIYRERTAEIAAELAMHFEQSRDWLQAVRYLVAAAENASRRSAQHEASSLARHGLELLKQVPDSAERAKLEIKLRLILGAALMVIKGFASEEVEDVFAAGRMLFWSQGPSPELFHMLWSLGLYYQFGSDIPASLQISEQLLELAESLKNDPLIMEAHRSVGAALVILGRCSEALPHLEKSAELYASFGQHSYSTLIGRDCKVMADSFAALALWALGQPDEAAERMARGMTLARELRHPETLIVAGHFGANLDVLRGEVEQVRERAHEAMTIADEYGFQLWLAYGLIGMGWAEAERGDEQGIAKMREGLAAYEATGARLWTPHFFGLLAAQLSKAGRTQEGLDAIERAFAQAERSGERYSYAELYRLKGEMLAQLHGSSDQAQACFKQALSVAKQQKAKGWEARIRTSISKASTAS